jgi:hypothetical protein
MLIAVVVERDAVEKEQIVKEGDERPEPERAHSRDHPKEDGED